MKVKWDWSESSQVWLGNVPMAKDINKKSNHIDELSEIEVGKLFKQMSEHNNDKYKL